MEDTIKGCLQSCGVSAEQVGDIAGSLVTDQMKKCMGGSDNNEGGMLSNIFGGKKEDKEDKEDKEEKGKKEEGGGGGGMDAMLNIGKSFF
ncbi:hypothetical protein ABVT39_011576 [Epinephelus coioides]